MEGKESDEHRPPPPPPRFERPINSQTQVKKVGYDELLARCVFVGESECCLLRRIFQWMPFFFLLLLRFLSSSSWNWLIDVSSPLSSKILSRNTKFFSVQVSLEKHISAKEKRKVKLTCCSQYLSLLFLVTRSRFFPEQEKKETFKLEDQDAFSPFHFLFFLVPFFVPFAFLSVSRIRIKEEEILAQITGGWGIFGSSHFSGSLIPPSFPIKNSIDKIVQ